MNGLYIGRFQPFHLGHLAAITFALSQVENLWIGIGSSNKSNEKRNPFTAEERKEMIISSLNDAIRKRIQIYYIPDVDDHAKWTYHVDNIVPRYDVVFSNDDFTQTLYEKRGIKVIPVLLKDRENLSGTNIRERIAMGTRWEEFVPEGTKKILLKIDAERRLSKIL
ncbi:MAG TPA: nicotinamide-nucleotide adenylyltransferase [Nitrosopumilaceae archaeon]|nr:nicotinamide-nucleotide adenylyltransferase [Nitrosopumilaceae archaeon]